MRTILIVALVAACGGKDGSPPPVENTTTPIEASKPDEPVPDYAQVCRHLRGLDDRCETELREALAIWPAEVRDETLRCLMKVESSDQMGRCDPDDIASSKKIESPDQVKKAKTIEARQFVKKLYDGARAYYMDAHGGGLTPPAKQFPSANAPITPPLGSCCKQGGKCEPEASFWVIDTWVALQFSVDDPHYYSYEYTSDDPSKSFTVSAYGDLDCDGIYSTFQMYGEATPDGPSGNAGLFRENELE